ncbi:DUF2846 domain-containing protein [Teredinibacter sp. KSP-S5-2]|uniref:DUF2846 domain-containing protein n=1 Tax=Teredinibacter sp. KSP-S5-2 TaxID=3034506 RepID=UPI0029346352|nr:DUF2846 domain-containing protein [Teredinibacter sp. KSP-S5-2]WNO08945.1 DUF2846 domain-containing protein [Teredinibacter sp. KSP-S5-2]
MVFRIVLLIFVVGTLIGCAASGPIYKQYSPKSTDSAVVYVYRISRSVNCCVAPAVYINDSKRDSLKNGGYLVYELDSGAQKITVGDGSYGFTEETLELNLEKGKQYFLKWNIGPIVNMEYAITMAVAFGVALGQREYNLVQMDDSVAKQEISSLKLSKK